MASDDLGWPLMTSFIRYARDLERVRSEAAELRVHADEGARAMQRTLAKVAELETALHTSEEARRRLEDAHR
jgi:hypothetical protein